MTITKTRPPHNRPWRSAILLAGVLVLGACGGGGGTDAGNGDTSTTLRKSNPATDSDRDGDAQQKDLPKPVALLPIDGEAPTGYTMGTAPCDAANASGERETGVAHPTWITYAVPEGWAPAGYGGGGSGGPTGTGESLSFGTDPDGKFRDKIEFELDWDQQGSDGTVLGSDGKPWESFDYTSSINGENEVTITYDKVGTVEVGDQTVDLYHLDPAQAPDHVTGEKYKARVEAFEMPSLAKNGKLTTSSFVVTVSAEADNPNFTQESVEEVLATYSMPSCTWARILKDYELMLGVDLDDDGKVYSAQDAQKDLQAKLDEQREASSATS